MHTLLNHHEEPQKCFQVEISHDSLEETYFDVQTGSLFYQVHESELYFHPPFEKIGHSLASWVVCLFVGHTSWYSWLSTQIAQGNMQC